MTDNPPLPVQPEMTAHGTPRKRAYKARTNAPKTAFGRAVHAVQGLAPIDLIKLERFILEYKKTMIAQLRGREG